MKNTYNLVIIALSVFLIVACGTEPTPIYTLTTSVNGEGTIAPSSGEFEEGEVVTLTSSPNNGWVFQGWGTDGSGSSNTLAITMNSDKNVTAKFIIMEVESATGRIWMDRNLGATRAATSPTDIESYGDLYQWGRPADGHQKRNSDTTSNLSSSDQPGHGDFIITQDIPYDWRSPQNSLLWQGVNGRNNPCPESFRLPTEEEWNTERQSWSTNDSAGAFASPLKLPLGGIRLDYFGSLDYGGSYGEYWSSSASAAIARRLTISDSGTGLGSNNRALGLSVRCIKN